MICYLHEEDSVRWALFFLFLCSFSSCFLSVQSVRVALSRVWRATSLCGVAEWTRGCVARAQLLSKPVLTARGTWRPTPYSTSLLRCAEDEGETLRACDVVITTAWGYSSNQIQPWRRHDCSADVGFSWLVWCKSDTVLFVQMHIMTIASSFKIVFHAIIHLIYCIYAVYLYYCITTCSFNCYGNSVKICVSVVVFF